MKFILFLILIVSAPQAFSQARVKYIHSSTEVLVELNDAAGFEKQKKVVVLSTQKEQIIAIGRVRSETVEFIPGVVKIEIDEIVDNYMIMSGDKVELLDFKLYKEKRIPGFFSLSLKGDKEIPAQFKELAYFGVFTSEGHTLDKKESLISPFQMQYGVTDNFGVKISNTLWLDGYANVGAKYRLLTNKRAKISVNGLGAYKVQDQDWIAQLGGVITIPSNSKFQTHFMANLILDPQYKEADRTEALGLFRDSDIRNITEYITDNWNRVLYGPVFNVELQTFGGTVSHMWIWTTFHLSLGIATNDFSNLTFGRKGYYYVYDMFWRF